MQLKELPLPRALEASGRALLLLVLLASAGHAQEVPDKGPRDEELPNFQQVSARLYRGGQPRTGGLRRLASLGVKTIINLRDCAKGQDRTGTVLAVYRITHDGWTSEQAKQEANRYGMKFWQRGMKDYISDYYRDHVPRARQGSPR
jgi:protein tyrosine/serine phosphatase